MVPLENTIAPENGPAKMTSRVTGYPEPEVVWTINGKPITGEEDNTSLEHDKKTGTYTLTLTGDLRGRGGQVKVTAKNCGGEAVTEAELKVEGRAPSFVERPLKCVVLEGDTCVFRCRVDGQPAPEVTWSKGKWRKMEANDVTRVFHDDVTEQYALEIDNVKAKDAGTYTCSISNVYGSDSCSVTLMVTENEAEMDDWLSQLKKTIVTKTTLEVEEVDWRLGLKVC